jgi:hypothetical protein
MDRSAMSAPNHPAPPSGAPPPRRARLRDGTELDLERVAQRACRAYVAEFPDYPDRYGPAGMLWCVHDISHILNWAVLRLDGVLELEHELAWLARVLEARDFPPARLARGVELLADALRDEYPDVADVAAQLDRGAGFLSQRRSFLP